MAKSSALKAYFMEEGVEAGCDEAGRGCLAGPVFAAAVILPKDFTHDKLDDSKKLTDEVRMELRSEIMDCAIAYKVIQIDADVIDKINILKASMLGIHQAVTALSVKPDRMIVDGNKYYNAGNDIPYFTIVGGDAKYYAIAAASILAKTERDRYMEALHLEYPQYGWNHNKGYPSPDHKEALVKYGITPYHRKSFKLLEEAPLPDLFSSNNIII